MERSSREGRCISLVPALSQHACIHVAASALYCGCKNLVLAFCRVLNRYSDAFATTLYITQADDRDPRLKRTPFSRVLLVHTHPSPTVDHIGPQHSAERSGERRALRGKFRTRLVARRTRYILQAKASMECIHRVSEKSGATAHVCDRVRRCNRRSFLVCTGKHGVAATTAWLSGPRTPMAP